MSSFEKIPMGILDKVETNKQIFIAEFKDKLQEVFPSAVKDGIVDFEALLNEFGKYAETDEKEKYNMTWVGKKEAIKTANEDIIGKTLKYVQEDSKDPETTQNLYIEGDNLEVLKLLRNSYYGKIKMIYIDPPYNTGNEFIYNDKFKIDREEYEKLEGTINEYNERLTINNKNNGEYHSRWLKSLYPRLKVARDLLTDDGVIFISIDDNEISNLKRICDEIYGEGNFIANIIWERAYSPVNLKKHFSENHDFIICYAKNIENLICNGLKRDEEGLSRYKNPDNDPRGVWQSDNLSVGPIVESKVYEIITPSGRRILPPNGRCWLLTKERFNEFIKDNRIWFGEDGNNVPRIKRFLSEVKNTVTPMTIWKYTEVGHSQDAKQKLKKLFDGKSYFDYPKSIDLIKRILELYTDSDSIVLDFFSGSATTAHATMQLNSEDNGNRKFIMVQLPELCNEKSEAYKNSYKNICEIGKERIRRAGEKIKEENKDKEGIESLDIGFKVFKVSDTNIRWISDAIKSSEGIEEKDIITQEELRENESYKDRLDFNPWFTDLDVVYEMMLKRQDIELTERIEKLSYIGDRTYLVGYTILVCLEENITKEMVRKISEIETSLSWIVFRDSAFGDDINLKTNTINLLRTLIKEKNPRNKNQKILWI